MRRRPDTELMSLDTSWNEYTLRNIDGDGEGLVNQGDGSIEKTVVMDVRHDAEIGAAATFGGGDAG